MKKNESYRILKYPPSYLGNYLSIRGDVTDSGIPVEFIKNNGDKWVYIFSHIGDKPIQIFNIGENQYFLVIISGIAYITDKENENSIKEIACGISEIFETKRQIILIENYSIIIIENVNKIKHFQSSNFSDIRENRIENGVLKGVLDYNFQKTKYEIDLQNLEFNRISETNKNTETNRKWWQIMK